MKIVGFVYRKIVAEKLQRIAKPSLETNITFKEVSKEDADTPTHDLVKMSFLYDLSYRNSDKKAEKQAHITMEGDIFISVEKETAKNLLKSWKKSEVPEEIKIPVFNRILRKCTARAIYLQEEINVPIHVPIPAVDFKS